MHLTSFYAAISALLFVALSIRTLWLRGSLMIPVGDSGNQQLLRAIRVHSNFAEYMPIALLLIYFTEVLAGWITAKLAPNYPLRHALISMGSKRA